MKIRIAFILFLVTGFGLQVFSQSFIKNTQQRPLSFKEMQLQFDDYKKKNDLSKVKGWKNFKRWENEMQLHTGTNGEPSHFDTYVNEIVNEANAKEQQSLSRDMIF